MSLNHCGRAAAALIVLSAAATVGVVAPDLVSHGDVASAHCTGVGQTLATQSSWGREYNINANTCNQDTEYTGRFCDRFAGDGVRIRMNYSSPSGSSAASNDDGACGLLWTYNDSDTISNFRICHYNSSLVLINCASSGTDRDH